MVSKAVGFHPQIQNIEPNWQVACVQTPAVLKNKIGEKDVCTQANWQYSIVHSGGGGWEWLIRNQWNMLFHNETYK